MDETENKENIQKIDILEKKVAELETALKNVIKAAELLTTTTFESAKDSIEICKRLDKLEDIFDLSK